MNSIEKIRFRRLMLGWYDRCKRDLPWRNSTDPYRIWVSEIMLQQTRVDQVVPYYRKFLKTFPTVRHLARARDQAVLKVWEGMGYYARARNLLKAARLLAKHLESQMPRTRKDLQKLPGIGPYTSAAIASIAFGEKAAVVDGNIERVISRFFLLRKSPKSPAARKKVDTLAGELISSKRPGDFNQAMMELGATICTPRRPLCPKCPVRRYCRARLKLKDPAVLPVRLPKKEKPHYDIVVAIIRHRGKIFIDRRPNDGLLGGLWEFPGGKLESGEMPEEGLQREIREELNVTIAVDRHFMTVRHAYTHFRITLHAFECRYVGGKLPSKKKLSWQWVRPADLPAFPFPKANKTVLEAILRCESEKSARN